MNEQIKNQYDSLYKNSGVVFGGGEPLKLLSILPKYLPKGRILDVGGGDGRNALQLARMGYEVLVVDLSLVGLSKLKQLAKEENLEIETLCTDITADEIAGEFDGVLMSFVSHHLDTEIAKSLIKKFQEKTTSKGIHMIAGFANRGKLYERSKKTRRFYPDRKDLIAMYDGWEILHDSEKEVTALAKNKQGERMKNLAVFFVAQKL